jgi:hypothetical protein
VSTQACNFNPGTYIKIHNPTESTRNVGLGDRITREERDYDDDDTSDRRGGRFCLEACSDHSEECLHSGSHEKDKEEEDPACAFSEINTH